MQFPLWHAPAGNQGSRIHQNEKHPVQDYDHDSLRSHLIEETGHDPINLFDYDKYNLRYQAQIWTSLQLFDSSVWLFLQLQP